MRLMRLTYGRSGSMLRRVLVAAPRVEVDQKSHWSLYLLMAVWIAIPVVASFIVAPGAKQEVTFVDTSRLTVPPTVTPVPERQTEAPAPRETEKAPPPTPDPKPAESEIRPSIARQRATLPETPAPRIERAPLRSRAEAPDPGTRTFIPRRMVTTEAPATEAVIARRRTGTATEIPVPVPVAAPLRPRALQPVPEDAAIAHPRTSRPRTQIEAEPPIAKATVKRRTSVEADTAAIRSVGVEREVSLATLDVCRSPQHEERGIKAVLSVIGSRQACSNEKGRFVFKGTQRVSSFNLFISPADGRRLSNRCEELENAHRCLTNEN